LDTRKNSLITKIDQFKSEYQTFKSDFTNFKTQYQSTTGDIQKKIDQLNNKKSEIHKLINCGDIISVNYCGCNNSQKYNSLCLSIDSITSKLNSININIKALNNPLAKEYDKETNYYNNMDDYDKDEVRSSETIIITYYTDRFKSIDV